MPLVWAAALGAGAAIGLILGLVGAGGSIIAVPLLVYVVGVPDAHAAIGTAAVAVSLSALLGLAGHARAGTVKWNCAAVFAAAGSAGAWVGAQAGKATDPDLLLALFGLLMVAVGISMLRPRKGAPWTFDVAGLARDLARLRADDGPVLVPVFDRGLDLSRAAAREIGPEVRIVIVEGNYLLLDQAPWDGLAPFWDVTLALDVPEAELHRRLVARWLEHGHDPDAAEARAQANDLPNARTVVRQSRPADRVLSGAQPAVRPEPSIR